MFKMFIRFMPFCCMCLLLPASTQLPSGPAAQELTEEQAESALRGKVGASHTVEFVTLRKVEATSNTRSVAHECLHEAQLKHIEMYGEGVLLNFLRTGGFVVLEFDAKTRLATHVQLVTRDETGKAAIHSEIVEGQLTKNEAVALTQRNESFSGAVLPPLNPRLAEVWRAFGGANPPTYDGHNDQDGYFAIPARLTLFTTRPDELMELSALQAELGLWTIRYAPSLPIFAASPYEALKIAHDELLRLETEFRLRKKEKPDFIYHLYDLDSITTRDTLHDRIQSLRELIEYLNQHNSSPASAKFREANISVATIPLFLGVMQHKSDRVLGAMSASGMISEWTVNKAGELVLVDVSEGGD